MRFKDFIVNTAIKRNYKDKILSQSDNSVLDNVYTSISDKLGYKLLDVEKSSPIKCKNKDWERILTRYSYDNTDTPKRFLEYDVEDKTSYYFGENGLIYKGCAGKNFELVSMITKPKLYSKHSKFLDFVATYCVENQTVEKQFMLLGYNDKHRYYVCTDGKFYYKIDEQSSYQECSKNLHNHCLDLINTLEQ